MNGMANFWKKTKDVVSDSAASLFGKKKKKP